MLLFDIDSVHGHFADTNVAVQVFLRWVYRDSTSPTGGVGWIVVLQNMFRFPGNTMKCQIILWFVDYTMWQLEWVILC